MDAFNGLHTEFAEQEAARHQSEQMKLTVDSPTVGDTLNCPACGDMLTLTPMDGWCGPHVGCVNGTVHTDWITTTGCIHGAPVTDRSKVFDYAIGRDDGDVEIRFTDGSRYDMPTAEWNALVDAAQHQGRLTYQ